MQQRNWRGEYRGGTPSVKIRFGGMYVKAEQMASAICTLQRFRPGVLKGRQETL